MLDDGGGVLAALGSRRELLGYNLVGAYTYIGVRKMKGLFVVAFNTRKLSISLAFQFLKKGTEICTFSLAYQFAACVCMPELQSSTK